MSEDYLKGFTEGFKSGFEAGKASNSPTIRPVPRAYPADVIGCNVCNKKFETAMGYVCSHPQCPSRITCGSTATMQDQ